MQTILKLQKMTYQKNLFLLIESTLHPDKNIYKEVAKALDIEYDAARRRVIADTAITFDEACTLKSYFNVTLDNARDTQHSNINFNFNKFNEVDVNQLFGFIKERLDYFLSKKNSKITIVAKDMPFFCNFLLPELIVFKIFYYIRIMWPHSKFENRQFDFEKTLAVFNNIIPGFANQVEVIRTGYTQLDTMEIWNKNSLNTHLENIIYSWEAGYFECKENALLILDKTDELLDHIKWQAFKGRKIHRAKHMHSAEGGLIDLYFSEGMQLENTVLINTNDVLQMYLILNTGDHLSTFHSEFCERGKDYINNLTTHSSPISKVSEKQRNKLFLNLKQRTQAVREKIERSSLL